MEANWIILALISVCAIALILFVIIRNKKDKDDVISSFNAEDDLEIDTERNKNTID